MPSDSMKTASWCYFPLSAGISPHGFTNRKPPSMPGPGLPNFLLVRLLLLLQIPAGNLVVAPAPAASDIGGALRGSF
jgi:hypothetical protein